MAKQGTVKVTGLRELQRTYALMGKEAKKGMRDDLKKIGEPVRLAAESKAVAEIRNIGDRWPVMRVGVTTKVGYVAPKARRLKGTSSSLGRPNLAVLLMERAMLPALAQNEQQIVDGLEHWFDGVADKGGF